MCGHELSDWAPAAGKHRAVLFLSLVEGESCSSLSLLFWECSWNMQNTTMNMWDAHNLLLLRDEDGFLVAASEAQRFASGVGAVGHMSYSPQGPRSEQVLEGRLQLNIFSLEQMICCHLPLSLTVTAECQTEQEASYYHSKSENVRYDGMFAAWPCLSKWWTW